MLEQLESKKKSKAEALSVLTEGFATIEEGLTLIDQIATNKITIITEGNNVNYICKALELFHIDDVEVLKRIENITGKGQLRIYYEFVSRVKHAKNVIFVWDCDALNDKSIRRLLEINITIPFIFQNNILNDFVTSGIENLLPVDLYRKFTAELRNANGTVRKSFDSNCKNSLGDLIIKRNNIEDFKNFERLIKKINELKN